MSSAAPSRISVGRWDVVAAIALAGVALAAAGIRPAAVPLLYLGIVTPGLFRWDLRDRRLPNALVVPGYAAGGIGILGEWAWTGVFPVTAVVASAGYFLFLLVLALGGGMGMGDVKLAGVLGLAAGLLGNAAAVLSPVLAFLFGGVAAILALRRGAGTRIPFGPFLLAGLWAAVVIAALVR